MPEGTSLMEEIEQLREEGDRAYESGQWDTALSKYKAMTALALTLNLKPILAEGYRKCGHIERMRGSFRPAEKMFEKALAVSTSDGDMAGIADSLKGLSTMFFKKGEYGQALRYGQEALSNARVLKDATLIGSILIDLGNVYCVTGKYDDGMKAYEEALRVLPEKEFLHIGRALNNMGETHKRHARYDEAVASLEKAIVLGTERGDPVNRAWSLFCAAECYARKGDPDKALDYLESSETILKGSSDEVGLQELYKVKGIALERKGDRPKAKEFFERSIKLGKKLNLPAETASTYIELGLMYEASADRASARECFVLAQALYQGVRLASEIETVRKHLVRIS